MGLKDFFIKNKYNIVFINFVSLMLLLLIFTTPQIYAGDITLAEYDYQEFELDNGLKIMVFPDNDIPLLRLSIYYNVGSIDEPKGKTGISHFLEHSMFLGTEAVPNGKIDDLISSVGGQLNAATTFDYTYYYHEVPSSMLELVMALEADRMTNLKFDAEEIAREKEVIKQERRMRTENNILNKGFEEIKAKAFADSSLEHNVIGWMDDIDSITVPDLQDYYNKYYAPNNALLVLSGDVKVEDVKSLAKKYYSDIAKSKIHKKEFNFPEQKEEIVHKINLDTQIPYTLMIYKIPKGDHKDIAALEIFLDILANQKSARLKEKLQKEEQLILGSGGFLYSLRVPSFALVYFIPSEKSLVDDAQNSFEEVMEELFKNGISSEEFEIVKKQYQKSIIFSQKNVENIADTAAVNQLRFGDPELQKKKIAILNNLTEEDIIKTAEKYFIEENRTRGYILPKDEEGVEN
jgi:zinc protease